MATRDGTTRTLRSEGGEAVDRLRVFVAEANASDLFWLEMVFKSSRLPYRIEVAVNAQGARQHLEDESNAGRHDLVLLDAAEIFRRLSASLPAFLLTNTPGGGSREVEKPFTQQKLLECLSAAGLDEWAARLTGKSTDRATAA